LELAEDFLRPLLGRELLLLDYECEADVSSFDVPS
jgi:hypothetical protein